jgi:hypothetical protein
LNLFTPAIDIYVESPKRVVILTMLEHGLLRDDIGMKKYPWCGAMCEKPDKASKEGPSKDGMLTPGECFIRVEY